MKNILFYYDNFCGEGARGGTEVATFRIAGALSRSGEWQVFNAFQSRFGGSGKSIYADVVQLQKPKSLFTGRLAEFIRCHNIDVMVNMGRFFRHAKLKESIIKSGRDVKLIFMHHFAPGSESRKSTYSSALHLLRLNPLNPLYYLRLLFYPLLKLPRTLAWPGIYKEVYESSDRVILLSEGYKDIYRQVAGLKTGDKFTAIQNIFDAPAAVGGVKKEKRVLMLSRMDEIQKRISLALKIWKKIEDSGEFADWHLDIVGSGHDFKGVKRLARTLRLSNVTFHGWKESRPFLEKSSILMMTSAYEGLSLSMLEAMAYGCVPVAFDSYASLRDVVDDSVNGLSVAPFGDVDTFAQRLASLMRDNTLLSGMAKHGMAAADKFSSEKIGAKWLLMLENLTKNQ